MPRFPKRIGRVPTKLSEIRENLEGGSRARQIVKDAVREPNRFLLEVGTEFEGTHASGIRDETRPVFQGWNTTKRLEGDVYGSHVNVVAWDDAHRMPPLLDEEERGVAASNKCRPLHAKSGPEQVRAMFDRRERLRRSRLVIQN